ncbi:ABC transporter substrate-binding protein [Poriferisphaera sp. WC338]|uniref:ABC transporter substrate-binding protein n=1 Tax=Poriferisphaera sp. WC338 TaxID=3425129 RepID=UPI003D81322A
MRTHLSKIVIVGLMLVIVGVPFLLRPAGKKVATEGGDAERLIIMTPHNEQIRGEFARAFNEHRKAMGKSAVVFDWRAGGGTSDLRKQILSQLKDIADQGHEDDGVGVDLFFGGGEYDHNKLAQGVKVDRDGKVVWISASVPAKVDEAFIKEVFPESEIGGEKLYRKDMLWVGTALSSFGVVYNRDLMKMLDVPEPKSWDDFARPEYANWAALADPGHSGSIAATYDTILKRKGWNEGWRLLRRAFANARYFAASSSKVPVDVSSGDAAIGMCIDFYGRYQASVTDDVRVGYVDPAFMTAITADPISVLRGAPNEAIAQEFVNWVLTKDAQGLWQRRVGVEGGPVESELRRQPIRQDMFVKNEQAKWADVGLDPFGQAKPFAKGMPSFFSMVATVTHAMGSDVHDDLKAAWAAINRVPNDDPVKGEMLRLFDEMPEDLRVVWPDDEMAKDWMAIMEDVDHVRHDEAVKVLKDFVGGFRTRYKENPDVKLDDRLRWTLFFRDNYRKIVELEKQAMKSGSFVAK